MNQTPFSGISLITHLLIIGVANVRNMFSVKVTSPIKQPREHKPRFVKTKIVLSHLIVATIFGTMFSSFTIAVRTGFREGQSEPQIIFIKKQISAVQKWTWSDFLGPIATIQ